MEALLERAMVFADQESMFLGPDLKTIEAFLEYLNTIEDPALLAERFDGVGMGRAEAIFEYRSGIERFSNPAQVLRVPDIGSKLFATMLAQFAATDAAREKILALGEMGEEELSYLLSLSGFEQKAVLNVLNTAPSSEVLASLLPGIGIDTASHLINERDLLPEGFTSLVQVEKVEGINVNRLTILSDTAGKAFGEETDTILGYIHHLLSQEEKLERPGTETLLELAGKTNDLNSLRYLSAALIAVDAPREQFDEPG